MLRLPSRVELRLIGLGSVKTQLGVPVNSIRRHVLQTGAALATVPFIPWTNRAFANESQNDRPRIGCIGVGGMGTIDATEHVRFGDILAVCDVDSRHAE